MKPVSRLLSAVAAIALAGVALAEDASAPPFPLQNDLPEGWDMGGADMPIDILGVKLGMPREQAVQVISAALPIDPNSIVESAQEKGIADQYGTQVFFKYVYWWNAATVSTGPSRDAIQLSFSTGISGERVTGMTRRTDWTSDLPRFPDMEKALIEKYGPPTYAAPGPNSSVYYWGYYTGQKFTIDDATAKKIDATADASGCLWNLNAVPTYDYEPEAQPGGPERRHFEKLKKDCNAVLMIRLTNDYDSQGLVRTMEVLLEGPKRINENFNATDAFLDKALADAIANSSGGPSGPKL
ncbi:hypothetical protein sos41_25220 [Alphaproteobacteria bacterium SO-S41]|nr:hypothetical protein sos41_25220 [Alphaproteobacteria bacterium SO-S41]